MDLRRRFLLIGILFMFLYLAGCGHKAYDVGLQISDIPNPTQAAENSSTVDNVEILRNDVSNEIQNINEILNKSSNGKSIVVAQLFGFAEILEEIRINSSDAIENGQLFVSELSSITSQEELSSYLLKIKEYDTQFGENKSLIKQAKKDQDMDRLENELDDLNQLILGYDDYLLEVLSCQPY